MIAPRVSILNTEFTIRLNLVLESIYYTLTDVLTSHFTGQIVLPGLI